MSAAIDPVLADAKRTLKDAKKTFETGRKKAPKIIGETKDALYSGADRAKDQTARAVDAANDQLDQARQVAIEQLETARVYVTRSMKEQPVAATLAAIGVGFFLGMLITGRRR